MLKTILIIFLGGGLGSVLRYLISFYTNKSLILNGFPLGTLLVNLIGCFLIGFLSITLVKDQWLRYLLIAGFCGGFTTFSTFSLESLNLYQQGNFSNLLLYIITSVVGGISLTLVGSLIGEKLI